MTLLNTTATDKKLVELPDYMELLQTFIVKEVPCPPMSCASISTKRCYVWYVWEWGCHE